MFLAGTAISNFNLATYTERYQIFTNTEFVLAKGQMLYWSLLRVTTEASRAGD